MEEYNRIQVEYREKCIERIERQLIISKCNVLELWCYCDDKRMHSLPSYYLSRLKDFQMQMLRI